MSKDDTSYKKYFTDAPQAIGPLKMEPWKDRLGIFASAACAVHCAATPVLLATLPALKFTEWMASPLFHQIAAVGCCALVAMAIWPAFLRFRDYRILSLSSAGLGLIVLAAFVLPDRCCQQQVVGGDVSLAGFTGAKLISVASASACCEAGGGCQDEHAGHDHAIDDHSGHNHASHSHAGHDHASHDHIGHEHEVGGSAEESPTLMAGVAGIQPWMTPLGGALLICAHGLNMRRRLQESACCGNGECKA